MDGGKRVFRIAGDGTILDDDEPFGRFVNDQTVSYAPSDTIRLAPDGKVSCTHRAEEFEKVLSRLVET
jgi:hypothetical protein